MQNNNNTNNNNKQLDNKLDFNIKKHIFSCAIRQYAENNNVGKY